MNGTLTLCHTWKTSNFTSFPFSTFYSLSWELRPYLYKLFHRQTAFVVKSSELNPDKRQRYSHFYLSFVVFFGPAGGSAFTCQLASRFKPKNDLMVKQNFHFHERKTSVSVCVCVSVDLCSIIFGFRCIPASPDRLWEVLTGVFVCFFCVFVLFRGLVEKDGTFSIIVTLCTVFTSKTF